MMVRLDAVVVYAIDVFVTLHNIGAGDIELRSSGRQRLVGNLLLVSCLL